MYDFNVASFAAAEPRLGGIILMDDVMLPSGIRVGVGVITNCHTASLFVLNRDVHSTVAVCGSWVIIGLEFHIALAVYRLSLKDQCFGRHGTADRKAESKPQQAFILHSPKLPVFASGSMVNLINLHGKLPMLDITRQIMHIP